jgi:ABC-type arginine/histidine transport system permease subunit
MMYQLMTTLPVCTTHYKHWDCITLQHYCTAFSFTPCYTMMYQLMTTLPVCTTHYKHWDCITLQHYCTAFSFTPCYTEVLHGGIISMPRGWHEDNSYYYVKDNVSCLYKTLLTHATQKYFMVVHSQCSMILLYKG